GEPTYSKLVPETSFEKYRGILPDALLTIWRKAGWASWANGLFWTVNPSDYDDLVELWLEDTPFSEIDCYHIIARSAFGKLYAWGQNNNQSFTISCPMNSLIALESEMRTPTDDPDRTLGVFFSSSDKEKFDMEDENDKPLFDQALKKLGPLASDEVYGFEPPLFAGGAAALRVDHLAKLKLDQHLTILRQLGGTPEIPFSNIQVDI
ncbi:FIG00957912: hypothetical protein, partial [hydrothermal vent metagenome]